MISRLFGYEDFGSFGKQWLLKNFSSVSVEDRKEIKFDTTRGGNKKDVFINTAELNKYRYYHPYMYKRKLTNEIIELFDVGYDKDTNSITFPVRDEKGNTLFIARRNVDIKLFNYPSNVEKPVYGLYELSLLEKYPDEIYITESIIDCLTLWTVGKYAVALNGLGTAKQFDQLNKMNCRKFILATDNDEAGLKARKRIRDNIKHKLITEVQIPYGCKDINDCTREQLGKLTEIL